MACDISEPLLYREQSVATWARNVFIGCIGGWTLDSIVADKGGGVLYPVTYSTR